MDNLALMYDRDGDASKIAILQGIVDDATAPDVAALKIDSKPEPVEVSE